MANNESAEKKTFGEVVKDAFKELRETFVAFVKAPKALWGINVPYIIEGLVYFGILTILGKYSSENLGLADTQASLIYSGVTGGITFAMLLFGGYSDKLGVSKSLKIAFTIMLAGRLFVALSGTMGLQNGLWSPMFWVMNFGLLLMVAGYGLYQPAAYAGVKRYTNKQTAAMGYAVIYGFMNLGAFFSGFISSFTRQSFEETFPPNGLTAVFWVYVFLTALSLLVTIVILTRKTDEDAVKRIQDENDSLDEAAGREKEEKKEIEPDAKINNTMLYIYSGLAVISFLLFAFSYGFSVNLGFAEPDVTLILMAVFVILSIYDYLKHRPYHPFRDVRFTFFIFILIPVQTLFAHNWLTLPYYLDRAFAGTFVSEYFEVFTNLNPILIFFLTPIVAGLTARANVYRMMIYGTFVMAIPTFLLALGPNVFLFLLYVLLMTIGEAMWQPRFLQWIAEIAPEGKTGLYMGVGQFPWFLTKVVTGFYSGWFLTQYCPANTPPSEMNTQTLWFIYGLIAIVSPIALVIAKDWMLKGFKTKAE
jgi:MFS family permease